VNKTLTAAIQVNSIPLLNFPELNCCGCGKNGELNLSPYPKSRSLEKILEMKKLCEIILFTARLRRIYVLLCIR
jgi:hypothetical protein